MPLDDAKSDGAESEPLAPLADRAAMWGRVGPVLPRLVPSEQRRGTCRGMPSSSLRRCVFACAVLAVMPDCRRSESTQHAAASGSSVPAASVRSDPSSWPLPYPQPVPRPGSVPGQNVETARSRQGLAPLEDRSECSELRAASQAGTVVCVPIGATESRPVVVVASSGPPREACDAWHVITDKFPFVLCPALVATAGRPGTLSQLRAGLRSALIALKHEYSAHVDPGSIVLVARGMLAEQSIFIAQQEPSFFRRLVLVDGGTETFSNLFISVFGQRGGERVLFVCGDDACRSTASARAAYAYRNGVEMRAALAAADSGTHWPTDAIADEWSWLVAGDPRYRRAAAR